MVRDAVKHQILPLVMLKYNSALVDRPTPGISAVRSSLLLSVQFRAGICVSLRLLDYQGDVHWNTVCAVQEAGI